MEYSRMAEMAVISARKVRLQQRAEDGEHWRALRAGPG